LVISCYGYGQAMVNLPCFSLWLRFPLGTPGDTQRRDPLAGTPRSQSRGSRRSRRVPPQRPSQCRPRRIFQRKNTATVAEALPGSRWVKLSSFRMGVEPGFLKVGTPKKKGFNTFQYYIEWMISLDDFWGYIPPWIGHIFIATHQKNDRKVFLL
jgi:hypothetical protein